MAKRPTLVFAPGTNRPGVRRALHFLLGDSGWKQAGAWICNAAEIYCEELGAVHFSNSVMHGCIGDYAD